MNDCRQVQEVVEAFTDGELPPALVLEVEGHIERCDVCAERLRFEHAFRSSTQRVVRSVTAPDALRMRIAAALEAERKRDLSSTNREAPGHSIRWLPWRTILPLAAAAGVALYLAAQRSSPPGPPAVALQPREASTVAANSNPNGRLEELLEDFVDYHSRAPAPQITEPSLVAQLEPQVGLPVRLPKLAQFGASWEGGGVMAPKTGLRAASLRYRLGSHRITVYVYDSKRYPLRAALEPRVVRNLPVYVGGRRGYSIAAAESEGIGYALATDLDYDQSAELAAELAQDRKDTSVSAVPPQALRRTERF